MLILYTGVKYDYGRPERGYSFEHHNFYDTLCQMGFEILYFDFMSLLKTHGKQRMNRRLLEVVKTEKPVLMFTVLFTYELDQKVLRQISEETETITFNWFTDDHWKFDNYSRYWAPCFNWVATTANSALPKYRQIGYQNVIKTQWACNHFSYHNLDLPLAHDVTFIGQPHGTRRALIQALSQEGIDVQAWGTGWENGRLTQEEMIRMFNQSRINLNLSNASVIGEARWKTKTKMWVNHIGLLSRLKDQTKPLLQHYAASRTKTIDPHMLAITSPEDQIKGRNFEVPGCGGLLLTGYADNLENYYHIQSEIVTFESFDTLTRKIRHLLVHEDERAQIAHKGYQRTLQEHTYVHRFREIFQRIGLPVGEFTLEPKPGITEELH